MRKNIVSVHFYLFTLILSSFLGQIQEINRKGIDQESLQPEGMKIWSDPFKRSS